MHVIDANFHRSHRATFMVIGPKEYYILHAADGYEGSFLHYASALHQTHYVREAIAAISPQSRYECVYAQEMCLLISATFYRNNLQYLAMLLDAGVSTQCRLHLFRQKPEGNKMVRAGKTMSFWMLFLARLEYVQGIYRGSEVSSFVFEAMEHILRDHPQSEVVMLAYESDGPFAITLSQLVRSNLPENMDRLLELLPSDSGKWHSWPHVKDLLANWQSIGSRAMESEHKCHYHWIWEAALWAIDCNPSDHPCTALASEDEIYVLAENLYLRVW